MKLLTTHYKLPRNHGFTLIELLLYVSIVGGMILSISAFLPLLMQSRVKNQTVSEVEQQGIGVMQIATQTVRNATAINSPTQGLSTTSLSVNVVDPTKNPTVFDLSSGAIRVKEGSGAAVLITNPQVVASGLTIRNLSRTGTHGTVQISFTLALVNPGGRQEYNFSKTFYASASRR